MRKNSILLAVILLVTIAAGCRSSYDLVYKASRKDRPSTAQACSELFYRADSVSTRIEYVKGDTVYFTGQTITVNCDSLVEANKAAGRSNNTALVPCPPSTHVTDTLKRSDFLMWQDLSKAIPLEAKVSKLEKLNEILEFQNGQKTTQIRKLWLWIVAFIAYLVFRTVCRIKFPSIYKYLL